MKSVTVARNYAEALFAAGDKFGELLDGVAGAIQADERIQGAGGLWALVDAARHCSDAQSRGMLMDRARKFAHGLGGARFPVTLRPLSMFAALAIRDSRRGEPFEPEGTPGRALTMLRHRLSGRLPRQG